MVGQSDEGYAYQRIADGIRQQIRMRELQAGQPIPSLPELCKLHGVSYATAQSAVALLKAWGLVEAKQGMGTYVRPDRPVVELMSSIRESAASGYTWREVASRFGMTGSQRIVGAGVDPAPGDVVDALGYEAGTPVAWRFRIILADGNPVQLVTSYFAHEVAEALPELARPERLPVWAPELMASAGFGITGGRYLNVARAATDGEAAHLAMGRGAAVSEILLVADSEGGPVMVEQMVSNSARIRQTWVF